MGAWIGHALAGRTRLPTYKLLNTCGTTYGLIGLLVLSEAVAKSASLKTFVVRRVAGVLQWGHTVIPLGALAGAGIGYALPSSGGTARIFPSFFVYWPGVLALLDATVFYPRWLAFDRWKVARRPLGSSCALRARSCN